MMKRNFDELRSIPIPLIELHVFRVCFYSVLIYNLFVTYPFNIHPYVMCCISSQLMYATEVPNPVIGLND